MLIFRMEDVKLRSIGMEALMIIAILVFVISLGLSGYYLYKFARGKYQYNIFSIVNLLVTIMGSIFLILGIFALSKISEGSALNALVFLSVSGIIMISMSIRNAIKTSIFLAMPASFYQILCSFIILGILWYAWTTPRRRSDRHYM